MLADLTGRVALVTGGGQGLGLGIVTKLTEQGADVAIADLNDTNASSAAEKVRGLGRRAWTVHMDVIDKASVTAGVDEILSAVGRIDILVNNAGIAGAPGSTGTAYRDIDWELDVESEREGPL